MIPKLFRCPKCKSEYKWSRDYDQVGLGEPLCPVCYLDFIFKNIPTGLLVKEPEDEKCQK